MEYKEVPEYSVLCTLKKEQEKWKEKAESEEKYISAEKKAGIDRGTKTSLEKRKDSYTTNCMRAGNQDSEKWIRTSHLIFSLSLSFSFIAQAKLTS